MLISSHTVEELYKNLYTASKIKAGKPAVEGLRAAKTAILEEPNRLNMDLWLRRYYEGAAYTQKVSEDKSVKSTMPPCQTLACLAGHVLLATEEGRKLLTFESIPHTSYKAVVNYPNEPGDEAERILDITHEQADRLFAPPGLERENREAFNNLGWPKKFKDAYAQAKSAKQRATVAANRIESFLESLK